VYGTTGGEDIRVFVPATAPTPEQLKMCCTELPLRHLRWLTRLSHLIEEEGIVYLAPTDTDPDNILTPLQAAASAWRIARGPRAGRRVLTLVGGNSDRREPKPARELCANEQRFSQLAGVLLQVHDRQGPSTGS
jgi:hypothetical protein